ncbi:OCRE domain-containing protein [Caldicellulosiruptor sp. DIB 104C]|nr:OCRE domain-containing protein [Caldicellulosiruptor sp. DIB 104C]
MKSWYKFVIPVVIVAVVASGYLIFSKPEITKQPAKNNQVQEVVEGYIYDEQTGRYTNKTTGVWYIVKDGYKVIPPEEYFPKEVVIPEGINISERPNDVWELKEVREITIQSGDTLVDIINPYFMNEHFRMNYEWYAKQVLKLNNITDPHFIKALDTLKIPIYIDKEAK